MDTSSRLRNREVGQQSLENMKTRITSSEWSHVQAVDENGYTVRLPKKSKKLSSVMYLILSILLFGVLLTFFNVWQLRRMQSEHMNMHGMPEAETFGGGVSKKPVVWIQGKHPTSGYLDHVFTVFKRLGYETTTSPGEDWDVLWCHDYPFTHLKEKMMNLKPHQRVNHFPGTGFVTNKVSLTTTSELKHVPKAFKIPKQKDELMDYAKANPDKQWVQKGSNHRGVKIKKLDELNFDAENTFVQEYIDNPFLIDGRRFDIGIYTVITSINPLRIYVNNGDWLVRFCPKTYHPFDPNDRLRYVITDDYLPLWKVPSLQKIYTEYNYPFKETLLTYLRSTGIDTSALANEMYETIREVYSAKEEILIKAAAKYKSSRHFFEMVRFDFILDKDMKLYLLEVNMSPNLSSGHFPPNKLLYEETLFGYFNLVRLARTVENDISRTPTDEGNMQVSDRDLNVYSENCISEICQENCLKPECKLCNGCLTVDQKLILKHAYIEHHNKKNWRRVMPKPWKSQEEASKWSDKTDNSYQNLSSKNKWMMMWFRGKCLQDAAWCS